MGLGLSTERLSIYIKGRGKNALIMSIVWIIVPVITAVYISSGRIGNGLIILMLMCAMFHFLGIIVYTGSYEAMAGFNTMSDEEIKEYDMEKMTSFLGIYGCLDRTHFSLHY